MYSQRAQSNLWRGVVHAWALRLGTAAFAVILVLHALQLADYESSLRQKFAYMRHAISFAIQ